MSNDFHPEHNTAEAFLGEIYSRQLATISNGGDTIFCIRNMTEQEVREAIVDDILAVTMWEIQNPGKPISYDLKEMLRFVHQDYRKNVEGQLNHPEIDGLFTIIDGQYRIIKEPAVLKAAMNYCGAWYNGYTPPEDVEVIGVNREKFEEVVKAHGSVENLAKSMAAQLVMDDAANAPVPTTLQ